MELLKDGLWAGWSTLRLLVQNFAMLSIFFPILWRYRGKNIGTQLNASYDILRSVLSQGVLLRSDSALRVTTYCDADWNACPLTCRSWSSYIVLVGSSLVSWKIKKQNIVSASSAEAEYRLMAYTLRELKWMKRILASFSVPHKGPMKMFCDSFFGHIYCCKSCFP